MNPHRYPLRVGVLILPDRPWREARATWVRAEELGFTHTWTYDHLTWRSHRNLPWFGAVPTLAAAAAVTTRMRLGPLVASANFRHPVAFAKELVSLDDISNGRMTVGLGAGATGWDASMLGQQAWGVTERTEQFEEFVSLLDQLLRSPETDVRGRFYDAVEARTYPGCVQRPRMPFAVAATKSRGMRIAATHAQMWVTTGNRTQPDRLDARAGVKEIRDQMALLATACADVGRDPTEIDKAVLTGPTLDGGLESELCFAETAGLYHDAGVTDLIVHWPRSSEPYRADLATFERIFGS